MANFSVRVCTYPAGVGVRARDHAADFDSAAEALGWADGIDAATFAYMTVRSCEPYAPVRMYDRRCRAFVDEDQVRDVPAYRTGRLRAEDAPEGRHALAVRAEVLASARARLAADPAAGTVAAFQAACREFGVSLLGAFIFPHPQDTLSLLDDPAPYLRDGRFRCGCRWRP